MRLGWIARTILLLLAVVLMMPSSASALAASTATVFHPIGPVIVSAYQTFEGGKDLDFVELYNSGNSLIDLNGLSILDVANDRYLETSSSFDGYLEPGCHVVLARSGVVAKGSTYQIDGWSHDDDAINIASLRLRIDGFRDVDVTLSAKPADLDQMMVRAYNTSSYSSAAAPFERAYRGLFDDGLYLPPETTALRIVEIYPYASDCNPNDISIFCGDYIKIMNVGEVNAELDGLVLRTSSSSSSATSSNTFRLAGSLAPGEYRAVWLTDSGSRIALTNSGGYVWLEDAWHLNVYGQTMVRYASAGSSEQGFAYALGNDSGWQWTSTPSPDGANIITISEMVLEPCAEGKYRSPETNRCRNIEEAIGILMTCEEGSERNPTTNRCRKIVSSAAGILVPCSEGQERNLATNRCRSIEASSNVSALKPCEVGWERNPATNRCRKAQIGDVKGASDYPVDPIPVVSGNTAGLWVIGVVGGIALIYGAWEWRQELTGLWRRVFRRTK